MKWFIKCLRHYADFSGRARRKEYWMFMLFSMITAIVIGVLMILVFMLTKNHYYNELIPYGLSEEQVRAVQIGNLNYMKAIYNVSSIVYLSYSIIMILPSMAVAVRRLHDIGKSGWNFFIGLIPLVGAIILIVWYCKDSEAGENQWGATPKTL
jgi:uncharacterized membrane protein YhaH (DUF805 family)